jgi:HEAT repeat protein
VRNPGTFPWTILAAAAFLLLYIPALSGEQPGPGGEALQKRIETLIERLGSDDWEEREDASKELIRIGEAALPALDKAALSDDPEVRFRADAAIRAISKELRGRRYHSLPVLQRAIRLLTDPDPVRRKGAAVTLASA